MFPYRPTDASHLVGQGDGGLVEADPLFEPERPALDSIEGFAGLCQSLGPTECRSSAVDDQHSKVLVSALGDPPQPSLVPTGAFQRCDAQPRCEVATRLEVVGGAGAGDYRGAGQQPDAWDLLEQSDVVVVSGQRSDLLLGERDLVFQVGDLLKEFGEDDAKSGREVVLIDDRYGMTLGRGGPGRDGMAQLPEASAKSVDASDPRGFPLLSNPMELLDLLLVDGPDRDRVDPPASIGVEQGFGVGLIGLVAQPVLSDELGWEHDGLVPEFPCLSAPEVGAAAGLEQHDGRIGVGEEGLEPGSRQPVMGMGLAMSSGEGDLEDLLCEIDGDKSRLVHGLLLS